MKRCRKFFTLPYAMPRKFFIVSNGLGLLFAVTALLHPSGGHMRLFPTGFMLLHIVMAVYLLRGRKFIRLIGIFTGIACGLSGWTAFLFVAAGSPQWRGVLGLCCFIAGFVLLVADSCTSAFTQKEASQ